MHAGEMQKANYRWRQLLYIRKNNSMTATLILMPRRPVYLVHDYENKKEWSDADHNVMAINVLSPNIIGIANVENFGNR
jgi:hypothetical protein